MKKRTGIISAMLCAAMVLSLVLSAAFIITYAEHDCVGDACEQCHHIQFCEQALKKISSNTAASVGIAFSGIFYVLIPIGSQDNRIVETLVNMKVKLSC